MVIDEISFEGERYRERDESRRPEEGEDDTTSFGRHHYVISEGVDDGYVSIDANHRYAPHGNRQRSTVRQTGDLTPGGAVNPLTERRRDDARSARHAAEDEIGEAELDEEEAAVGRQLFSDAQHDEVDDVTADDHDADEGNDGRL